MPIMSRNSFDFSGGKSTLLECGNCVLLRKKSQTQPLKLGAVSDTYILCNRPTKYTCNANEISVNQFSGINSHHNLG